MLNFSLQLLSKYFSGLIFNEMCRNTIRSSRKVIINLNIPDLCEC
jgi:hypothetical protein